MHDTPHQVIRHDEVEMRSNKSELQHSVPAARPAAIWTQTADPSTALEVDVLILDYLAHQTAYACLGGRLTNEAASATPANALLESSICTTNAFLHVFQARHNVTPRPYKSDPELRFRIELLKLVTLFTQRLTHNLATPSPASLQKLRRSNHQRARHWLGNQAGGSDNPQSLPPELPSFSISEDDLSRNRARVLHALDIPAEDELYTDAHYGTSASLSLLDLLPLFMRVSALRNSLSNSSLTDMWMQMAGEFILQACLEQVLVVGAGAPRKARAVVEEASAWGWKDMTTADRTSVEEEAEDKLVNDMFEDPVYEAEVDGWADIKATYLEQLVPPQFAAQSPSQEDIEATMGRILQESWPQHFQSLAIAYPIQVFERTVLTFLTALSASLPTPILAQLEEGEPLDGMSLEETKEFLKGCGLGGVGGCFVRCLDGRQEAAGMYMDVEMDEDG